MKKKTVQPTLLHLLTAPLPPPMHGCQQQGWLITTTSVSELPATDGSISVVNGVPPPPPWVNGGEEAEDGIAFCGA